MKKILLLLILAAPLAAQTFPFAFWKSGTAGFQPSDISNMMLWLQADKITGKANGDTMYVWSDASGRVNDFFQLTAAKKPLYRTDSIGSSLPSVFFDGTDDFMQGGASDDFNVGANYAWVFVSSTMNGGTSPVVYWKKNYGAGSNYIQRSGTLMTLGTGAGGDLLTATMPDTSGAKIRFYVMQDSAATTRAWNLTMYGTVTATGQTLADNTNIPVIMAYNNGTSNFTKAQVFAILCYKKALTLADINNLRAYFATRLLNYIEN